MSNVTLLQHFEQNGILTVEYIREFFDENYDGRQLTDNELLDVIDAIYENLWFFMKDVIEWMSRSEDFSGFQPDSTVPSLPNADPAPQPDGAQHGPSTTESP